MSRRKQSNPKPAKRETVDFDQIVSELNLPVDRVYLRKFGEECLVLAKEHLKAGTVLGTYKCHVKESPTKDDDKNILKISRSENGAQSYVMIDNEGHWLKLMRTAILPTDANILLRISGRELVCKVTKDVNKEVELKVTCRIEDHSNKFHHMHTEIKRESSPIRESYQNSDSKDSEHRGMSPKLSSSPVQKVLCDCPSGKILDCSGEMLAKKSASNDRETVDSKKLRTEYSADESDCDVNDAQIDVSNKSVSPSSGDRHEEKTNGLPFRGSHKSTEPHTSVSSRSHGEDDRIYRCSICTFASGDKFTIDKHLQCHRTQTSKKSSNLTNAKSFCEACKIQFMSLDTYIVHKQFYCKSRHEKDEAFMSPTVQESTLDISSNAIKPGPETVIIRSGINGGLTSSMIQPQAIYAAISTNPLILLPCSLVNGQRLVPHSSVVPTGGPGIVLQSGIACPTIVEKPSSVKAKDESLPSRKTSHPIMNFSVESLDRSTSLLRKRKMSEGDVLNLKKSCNNENTHVVNAEMTEIEPEPEFGDPDAPLDLSLKKKCQLTSIESIPKRKNSVVSTGCPSPSFPNTSDSGSPPRSSILHSRMTMSPCSYSNESLPCYTGTVPVPVPRLTKGMSERLSPSTPMNQADATGDKAATRSGMLPPKLLKQGNNICEECQIVFYKYDNYLAHKKHYCAYRRQQLSAIAAAAAAASNQDHSSDDNSSNHSGQSKPSGSYHSDEPVNAGIRRMEPPSEQFRTVITKSSQSVFCCDSCGVKFSTSDNLNAHQTYYCIKRADSAMSKVSSARAENSDSPKSLESPFAGPEEWKCNYCDATCASYDTIRRHLLTHSELRGFRCIVCGYKGNTLRGMRSHACEHITEGSTSIEEFVSSNVVAENGMIPIMPPMDQSDDDSDLSRDSKRERSFSDRFPEKSLLKKDVASVNHSKTNESPISPRIVDKDSVPTLNSPIKSESGESGNADTNGNSQQDSVNPVAFCDVVIKTENEQSLSGEDSCHESQSGSFIKFEPEPEYDSDEKPSDLSKSPPAHVTSVIRRACEPDKVSSDSFPTMKKKGKFQNKQNSESKYCKSCDISFSHLSNFLAHKKFYCVSRVIQNCHQEAATVQ